MVQVAAVQGGFLPVVQPHGHRASLGVEGKDLSAAAVGHPKGAEGVLAAHHRIPDGELAVADLEAVEAELAGVLAELLAGGVELVDLLAPVGQDRHPLALLEGLPPVAQEGLLELAGGLGGDQPPVGTVGAEGGVEVAGAEVLDRLPLPGFLLAAILGQLAGAQPQPQPAEAAAGLDGGQLPVVAHQHHLCPSLLGVVKEPGELAGAKHAGLIHHQHRPGVQQPPILATTPATRVAFLIQLGQQPVHGTGVLKPLGVQTDGGDPGRRCAEDLVAVQLPGVPGHPERVGLAGAGPPDHHLHAGAALAQVADHRLLVDPHGRMVGQGVANHRR